jgi:hypothetical protein
MAKCKISLSGEIDFDLGGFDPSDTPTYMASVLSREISQALADIDITVDPSQITVEVDEQTIQRDEVDANGDDDHDEAGDDNDQGEDDPTNAPTPARP